MEKNISVVDSTIVPIDHFFVIKDIEFQLKSHININEYTMLDSLASYLINNPKAKIKITSYTDSQGNKCYNTSLSLKRARLVKNHLIKKGVTVHSLVIEGNGSFKQISKNKV